MLYIAVSMCKVYDRFRRCRSKGVDLACNLSPQVDPVWTTRPADPCGDVRVHELEYAGESVSSKLLGALFRSESRPVW